MKKLGEIVGIAEETRSLEERMAALIQAHRDSGRTSRVTACRNCSDRGRVITETGAEPCPTCRPTVEHRLQQAGVPPHECRASLERDVSPQNADTAGILRDLAAARFVIGESVRSLYFHGEFGRGKSWLAAGLCRYVAEHLGWSVRWVKAARWLEELRSLHQASERGDETELSIGQRYRAPRLLVLNELPREVQRPWVAGQVEDLVDERLSARKVTVITGNLDPEDLERCYGGALASRMGMRFFDWIPFGGVDLRRERDAQARGRA